MWRGLVHRFGVNHILLNRSTGGDGNAARLQCFGHFAGQFDMQQTILMGGAGDTHVIGQGKAALKGTGGDATVQVLSGFIAFFTLAGSDDQRVFLDLNGQVTFGKTSNGNRDTIGVFVGFFDVIGG